MPFHSPHAQEVLDDIILLVMTSFDDKQSFGSLADFEASFSNSDLWIFRDCRFNLFLDPNSTAIEDVLTFHSLIQSSFLSSSSLSSSSLSSSSLSSSSLFSSFSSSLSSSFIVYWIIPNQHGPHSTHGLLRQHKGSILKINCYPLWFHQFN